MSKAIEHKRELARRKKLSAAAKKSSWRKKPVIGKKRQSEIFTLRAARKKEAQHPEKKSRRSQIERETDKMYRELQRRAEPPVGPTERVSWVTLPDSVVEWWRVPAPEPEFPGQVVLKRVERKRTNA